MTTATRSEEHPEIADLQAWHRAKEHARRFNRNLLQYAGALAAILGIGGSAGSVLALAISVLEKNQGVDDWMIGLLAAVGVFVGVIAVPLIFYLVRAFRLRLTAEVDANEALDRLIARDPSRFWPQAGQE